jgi:membrane protein
MLAALENLDHRLARKSRQFGRPWGTALHALRYPAALLRDWLAGDIDTQAMSLAYTTLLSLVPLMVFIFSILKRLGAHSDLRFILNEFFRPLGRAEGPLTETVLQFVENMRGELLGTIGLAMLVYTAVSTIQKVEAGFNFVWRIDRPRSFGRRFTELLSVMIAGPILLAVALELLASAVHSPAAQWLVSFAHLSWAFRLLGQLLPYAIVTMVFTFMYAFIPNTHVDLRPALIGGVTAGLTWALVGHAFSAFIAYSSHLVAVYTGFAIVMTALLWIYVSWLILLICAQLACYVQFPHYLGQRRKSAGPPDGGGRQTGD